MENFKIDKFNLQSLQKNTQYIGGIALAQHVPSGRKPENFKVQSQSDIDKGLYKGQFGMPVYSDLHIEKGQYIDSQGKTQSYPEIKIPSALITLSQTKNVIETSVQGLDDTIKEYVSEGSWNVNIKGIILGSNNVYPKDLVKDLIDILRASAALRINNWYLEQFGIYNVVVIDKNIPQEAGGYSQQIFEFNAKSDTAIELF